MRIKRHQKTILLGALAVLISLVIVHQFLITGDPFELGGDQRWQHFPFFAEFRRMIVAFIKHRVWPFYSWNLFLGTDFWSSKSFYMLSDIYSYVMLLINGHYLNTYLVITIVKWLVSCLTMFWLLNLLHGENKANILFSLIYGFSSWAVYFLEQPMFLSFYSFVPLYFAGIELILRKNKYSVFLVSTSLLILTNFYLFFSLSFFTPFYVIARYYSVNQGFKGFFGKVFKMVAAYAIGCLVTMPIILPTILYMFENSRVGAMDLSLVFQQLPIYFHQLQSMLIPPQAILSNGATVFDTGIYSSSELLLWASSLTALMVPQLFKEKDKFYQKGMLFLYGVLALILVTPIGNMAISGFSGVSFRWTYLLIVINVLHASRYLAHPGGFNKSCLSISFIVYGLIMLFNLPLVQKLFPGWYETGSFDLQYWTSLISVLSMALTYFILFKLNGRWILLLLVVLFELTVHSTYYVSYLRKEEHISWEFIQNVTHVLEKYPDELNYYILSLDEENESSFYRVFVPSETLYWNYGKNTNLFYNLKSLSTYDSNYEPSFDQMKKISNNVRDSQFVWLDWQFDIRDPNIFDFLATKYAVVTDVSELPHQNFELVSDKHHGLLIYENLNYTSVGITLNKVISYESTLEPGDGSVLAEYIVASEKDLNEILPLLGSHQEQLKDTAVSGNTFSATADLSEKGFMVLKIPYNRGWHLKVNDEAVKYYEVSGGFIGFALNEGLNHVTLSFTPRGFKTGVLLSGIGITAAVLIIIREIRKERLKHEKL